MHKILQEIIAQKQLEVLMLKTSNLSSVNVISSNGASRFKQALSGSRLNIIGEIKRMSPAKGKLVADLDLISFVRAYVQGGVKAISVLTDQDYFGGSLADLQHVVKELHGQTIPVLRKDFILDEIQIIESAHFGADAILLIVALLQERTSALLEFAKGLGLDVIVEVHTEAELNYALEIKAEMIGINNRNLKTFEEDINVCLNLGAKIPKGIIKIAESSIKTGDDIKKIKEAGFDAALIGSALVQARSPMKMLQELRGEL